MEINKRIFDIDEVTYRYPIRMDGEAHMAACRKSSDQLGEFLPWMVNAHKWDLKQHQAYVAKLGKERMPNKTYSFHWQGELVGMGHIRQSDWNHSAELFYWVTTGFDGLGIGEKIAKVLLRDAFNYEPYRHVVIKTDRDNIGSKRIMEKVGAEHALYTGYITHKNQNSIMIIWVVSSPLAKKLGRYSLDYAFNPIPNDPNLATSWRIQRDTDPDYSAVSNPQLLRKVKS